MLFLSIRLFHRRKSESANLLQDSAEPASSDQVQVTPESPDQNQTHPHSVHLKAQLQKTRSNYFLERRTFW